MEEANRYEKPIVFYEPKDQDGPNRHQRKKQEAAKRRLLKQFKKLQKDKSKNGH